MMSAESEAGDTPPPDWAVHRPRGGAVSPTGAPADSGTRALWLRPYLREKLLFDRVVLHTPLPDECALELTVGDEPPRALRYGVGYESNRFNRARARLHRKSSSVRIADAHAIHT